MQALNTARTAIRRAAVGQTQPARAAPRRGLATEPEVSWAEYRSGKVTLSEWVDANRHIVALGLLSSYGILAGLKVRSGRKKKKDSAPEASEEAAAASS